VEPGGRVHHYDKRHLFRIGDENLNFDPGSSKLILDWKGWKICPLICYDLRFPVWSRNRYDPSSSSLDYDLLVYVANWPASRTQVWNTLLKARSIENLCFTAGLNITGKDGMGIHYRGHSQMVDFKGEVIQDLGEETNTASLTIDKKELIDFRDKFPVYLDADPFRLL
jgi:predicted amidohydrolase